MEKLEARAEDFYLADDQPLDELDFESDDYSTQPVFLFFRIDQNICAVRSTDIQEIIRLPSYVELPRAPSTIIGMSNLRGQVLPIIDLKRMLNNNHHEIPFCHDSPGEIESSRVLVAFGDTLHGLLVDEMLGMRGVEGTQMVLHEYGDTGCEKTFFEGVLKDQQQERLAMLINVKRIVAVAFSSLIMRDAKTTDQSNGQSQSDVVSDDRVHEDIKKIVRMTINGRFYGVDLDHIQEIVRYPQEVTPIPEGPSGIIGLFSLREHLLPILNLYPVESNALVRGRVTEWQKVEQADLDEHNRVVVIGHAGYRIGIHADEVHEVMHIQSRQIQPFQVKRSSYGHDQHAMLYEQVCVNALDHQIIPMMSVPAWFSLASVQAFCSKSFLDQTESEQPELVDFDEEEDKSQKVLIFQVNNHRFGVDINCVHEIVRLPDQFSPLPGAPSCVLGLINLRGNILPVLRDQKFANGHIGLPSLNEIYSDDCRDSRRIVVISSGKEKMGIYVDQVLEVISVDESDIAVSPISFESGMFMSRAMVHDLDGCGIVPLIDIKSIRFHADSTTE